MSGQQSQTQPQPKRAEVKPAVGAINLKVASQDGNEIFFKIKRDTPLKRLLDAYCERQGVDHTNIRFLYDGERVADESTPNQMGMEDQDVIDAVLEQTGGCV